MVSTYVPIGSDATEKDKKGVPADIGLFRWSAMAPASLVNVSNTASPDQSKGNRTRPWLLAGLGETSALELPQEPV